jgi:uncharacterized protein YcfJ
MKLWTICAMAVAGLLLAGCETPYGEPNRTATGALIGGGFGAAAGALSSHHHNTGALVGGAIGALAGGLVGQSMDIDAAQRERLEQQAPQTWQRVQQFQPLGLADIKALAAAGISDDVIISQIRNSNTVYHLSTADIIDLKNSGVSERVIDYMINTPQTAGEGGPSELSVSPPPPPPQPVAVVPQVLVAPAPGFIWIEGDWTWGGFNWVWVGGHWARPPYPHARWEPGRWDRYRGRSHWSPGHWR